MAPNQENRRKPIVGLIGGIGSGKTLVADRLRSLGAFVIDADGVGHEVLREDQIVDRLAKEFGQSVLDGDGRIDRKKLGAIVFQDPAKRRALEAIVHPRMAERFRDAISSAMNDDRVPLIVLDAAILLESGWDSVCDLVAFVDAPREARLARLKANRGWTEEELDRRELAQWPVSQKKNRADVVIRNDSNPDACMKQVDELFREWTSGSNRSMTV